MIFYLGSGCLHCVEQVHKFAALERDYRAAGISIVAISTEPLDSLSGLAGKTIGHRSGRLSAGGGS